MILGLMAAFALVNGHGIAGVRWGILIDNRDRMSLSRLQMLAWMLLILSAVLTAILGNVSSGSASPMDIQIPSQLWILLGISTTTAVSAPALLNNKRPKQPDDKEMEKTTAELMTQGHAGPDPDEASVVLRNASIQDARWSDLLKGDESGNASSVDLGKLQMFYFTFILVCGYGAALYAMFKGPATVTALPPVQDGMNVMLGISQVGYLASKAVHPQQGESRGAAADDAQGRGAISDFISVPQLVAREADELVHQPRFKVAAMATARHDLVELRWERDCLRAQGDPGVDDLAVQHGAPRFPGAAPALTHKCSVDRF